MDDINRKRYEKIAKITGILIGLVLILGISYAVFKTTTKADKSNTVSAGKLDVRIENETEAILLENAYPITEEEGKKQDPYIFDVVNKGTINAEYDLYVEIEDTTTLPLNRVRYYLTEEEDGTEKIITSTSRTLSQEEVIEKDGKKLYKINTNYINITKTNTYKLYLWIDYDATVEEVTNKTFEAHVRIEAAQYQKPYIELDYIESTGTQWINTGIIPIWSTTNKPIIKLKGKFNEVTSERASYLFALYESKQISVFAMKTRLRIQFAYVAFTDYYPSFNDDFVIEMDYTNKRAKVNNIVQEPTSYQYSTWTMPIYLFANNDHGDATRKSKVRIYYFQYDDNTQHRNLIPVIRKSDGEVCMYDKVSKQYFTNQGTGDFIAGSKK